MVALSKTPGRQTMWSSPRSFCSVSCRVGVWVSGPSWRWLPSGFGFCIALTPLCYLPEELPSGRAKYRNKHNIVRNLRVPRATPKHKENVDLRKRSPLVEASGEASCLVHLRCCHHNVGLYSEIVTLLLQMVFLLVISSSKIHPISNHQICSPKTQFSPLHCLDETPSGPLG